ncbi:AAA domain-containing protein [Helicobacter pylori]|uniref:AAA domain-containing protein n=1 Tax=Helicobacter pylori TaxID=210 RepID=UPI003F6948D4
MLKIKFDCASGSGYSAELIKGYKGEHQLEKTSSYNKDQVQKIIELLEQINRVLNQRKIRKTIGIITPYNAQKRRLRSEVEKYGFKNFDELKIDTVDAFQGEEADIIIYSTVKTCGNLSFFLDSKRLNVAISRAKENLIFVGKKSFFENLRSDEKNIFSAILISLKHFIINTIPL